MYIYISKGFAPAAGPPSNRPDGCKISDPGVTKNGDLRGLEAPFSYPGPSFLQIRVHRDTPQHGCTAGSRFLVIFRCF